jgi:hypothetical protein
LITKNKTIEIIIGYQAKIAPDPENIEELKCLQVVKVKRGILITQLWTKLVVLVGKIRQ